MKVLLISANTAQFNMPAFSLFGVTPIWHQFNWLVHRQVSSKWYKKISTAAPDLNY